MTEAVPVPVVIILHQAPPPSPPSPESMASSADTCPDDVSAAALLLRAATIVPTAHYLASALILLLVFIYNFLEIHLLRDLLRGFRGDSVALTFHPSSKIYEGVVSKCRILHGRYLVTPWLASPHLQTVFLNVFREASSCRLQKVKYLGEDGENTSIAAAASICLPWDLVVFQKRLPPEAVDLVSRFLQYSPNLRCTALEACMHPFFDELRDPNTRLPNGRPLPPLFNFKSQEVRSIPQGILERLIPEHARKQSLFMALHS